MFPAISISLTLCFTTFLNFFLLSGGSEISMKTKWKSLKDQKNPTKKDTAKQRLVPCPARFHFSVILSLSLTICLAEIYLLRGYNWRALTLSVLHIKSLRFEYMLFNSTVNNASLPEFPYLGNILPIFLNWRRYFRISLFNWSFELCSV